MTNRDTQDIIMGKIIDLQEIGEQNHQIIIKSLESVTEILAILNERVSELESQMKG